MKRGLAVLLAAVLLLGGLPMGVSATGGKARVLMEATTGTVLLAENAHEKLPPASVTKIMTMLLVMEALDTGCIGWEDTVTASETAAAKGGSQIYLKVGETMTVRELFKAVAVSSANDAACALAELVAGSESAFVEKMNEKADFLGMENTHFVNCTGLDDDPQARQHLTTAYDIALMSRALLTEHPVIKEFSTIWMDTVRNGEFGLANTNKLVRFYSGCTGLKTGYTSASGFCLSASAQREGMELIAVVLGCDSSADRFATCRAMLDQGFAGYSLIVPTPEAGAAVPVKLGRTDRVEAAVYGGAVVVEKSQRQSVRTELELEQQVVAPVSKGQRLGTLTVYAGQQVVSQLPVVAREAVARLGFGEIFGRLLQSVCFG